MLDHFLQGGLDALAYAARLAVLALLAWLVAELVTSGFFWGAIVTLLVLLLVRWGVARLRTRRVRGAVE